MLPSRDLPTVRCIAVAFILHTCVPDYCQPCRHAEDTLVHEIGALNSAIQTRVGTTAERKKQLNTEYIKELSEFLSDHKEFSSAELQGRISGSLQWRRQRGEHA
eukprot:m.1362994 g.1362994  ORF g.1362994 m.1362994 type:complete len:104 (+) comp24944_c0_seq29:2744-3055(+)